MKPIRVLGLFLGLSVLLLSACGESSPPPSESPENPPEDEARMVVTFAHVPSVSASEKLDQLLPLKEYLEERLSIEFRIEFAEDYSQVVERLNHGDYDFATLGPFSYVRAARDGNLEVALQPIRNGDTRYRSILFTSKQSSVKQLSDLRGKDFAFVDRSSASGYLFPRAYMMKHGINPEQDLASYRFMGSHTDVVVGVWLGKLAAGAVYEDARTDQSNANSILEETRVIARTDPIPNEPWVFRKQFTAKHPQLVKEIKQLMLDLKSSGPQEKTILDRLRIDGFVDASDSEYDTVRDLLQYLPQDS